MRRSAAIIALSAGITTGCDFDRKVGGMMLVAAPLVYLLGLAAIRALWEQWRKVRPDLEFDGGLLHGGVVALLIAVAVWGARITVPALVVLIAVVFLGSAVLTVWLIAWRVAVAYGARRAVLWTGLVTMALMLAPAILLYLGHSVEDFAAVMWLLFGGFGSLGWLLFVTFMVEAAIRSHQAVTRDAAGSGRPPAPDDLPSSTRDLRSEEGCSSQ